ncbi:nucleotide sugar dehydrogenase [Candidatus Uhrbacteria bacterium]|nr:nucleotide sugar dehydrogenase [Candidatus Uhrbacteria bacterium]
MLPLGLESEIEKPAWTPRIAVVGLGYVGLPLAVAFGRTEWAPVIGYNRSEKRVKALQDGNDPGGEITRQQLSESMLELSTDPAVLERANFIIATPPTPITKAKQPDLTPVIEVSTTIGAHIRSGTIVVFESTVYPGVTEDICVPIIEKGSGLVCGKDWFIGYSPERINPGDHEHTVDKIVKIVSGMDALTLEKIAMVYGRICVNGVHRASNIKTAEAAKVIENIQRDLNIALVNECSLIFEKLGIDTREVLDAAGTKWNFHKYSPGLVGGHCIGVDPYYLTHKAQELGYDPQVILAGRHINDSMAQHLADRTVKAIIKQGKPIQNAHVLVMGLTFKEDVRDIRNSKAFDVVRALQEYGVKVSGYDPLVAIEDLRETCAISYYQELRDIPRADAVVVCSPHSVFRSMNAQQFEYLLHNPGVFMDVKGVFSRGQLFEGRDVSYLRL